MSAPESLRDEVAAALAEHSLRRVTCGDEWIWECAAPECAWMDSRDIEGLEGHREHLADALLASPALASVIREAAEWVAERVTLTTEERASLADAFDHEVEANCWRDDCDAGIWESVERILAAREQAVREEFAGQIEDEAALRDYCADWRDGMDDAASIARGETR